MEITKPINDLWARSVGELVAEDYRRADVFRNYGIDFCCGGGKSLREVCRAKAVEEDEIIQALETVAGAPKEGAHLDMRNWAPDFLASYIVNVHHGYVRDRAPVLRELTRKVARVHGKSHPESVRIAVLTDELLRELGEHMVKEEEEYFPYVELLCKASRMAQDVRAFRSNAVVALEHEHDRAGTIMRKIRELSGHFDTSEAPCTTFRLAYIELENFETDLHRHVHLENNILFPAAARLEKALGENSAA